MISFENDYSEGTCKEILDELTKTNYSQATGYGKDPYCLKAAKYIKKAVKDDKVDVHFVPGGTPCNILACSLLKDYEGVICAATGHINVHETGAIENTGHKCLVAESVDGKLTPASIEKVYKAHPDEHMVKPALVFIANSTEIGTIYTKKELTAISKTCKKLGLYLYMDGARLGSALTAKNNDLTLADINKLCALFYIGGTKNGALLGEAMVIRNDALKKDFRYNLKNKGFMLAKHRTEGISFYKFFEGNLYFDLAKHANEMAEKLRKCFKDTKTKFFSNTTTNQIFVILDNEVIKKLRKRYVFENWGVIDDKHTAVRFVTSWATTKENVDTFIKDYKNIA